MLNEKVIETSLHICIVSKCIEQLLDLIDHVKNVGIEEIVEIIRDFAKHGEEVIDREFTKHGKEVIDKKKLQLRRVVIK